MEERIDKWLWAMRVFKTRTIATDACKKGRVMMGGNAVKPSRTVKPGDVVEVRKPPITYTFRVKAVTGNRLGAKLLEMTRISGFVDRRKGLGRPTKRDSRELSRFREDTYADTFYLDFEDEDDD